LKHIRSHIFLEPTGTEQGG